MLFTLSRFDPSGPTLIGRFASVEAAREALVAFGFKVFQCEEDDTYPNHFDIAAARGPVVEVFTLEPGPKE